MLEFSAGLSVEVFVMDRVPQRKYSPRALEHWFQRLTASWEELFSAEELTAARLIYRLGDVRSIELAEDHAIIHGGREKDDIYAVIDWPVGGAAHLRHSVSDRHYGRTLAAAGLYEIEELVAEEAVALPFEETAAEVAARSREKAAALAAAAVPQPAAPPGRPLQLQLRISDRGLNLTAKWGGKHQREANAFRSQRLAPGEREALIALTTRAHKVGFEPRTFNGDYVLRDPERMAAFVQRELPRWCQRFQIDADLSVTRLGAGVRTVDLELQVDRNGRGLQFQWAGKLSGESLGEDLMQMLLRRPQDATAHPEHGLLRLNSEQSRWVRDWQPVLEHRFDGVLPFYMIFSLSAQHDVPVLLSKELEAWRNEVESGLGRDESGLLACLRPYQRTGVRWLRHLLDAQCHPLLADEMGLGKTLQMLNLFHADPGHLEGPSLVVCPASVLPVWEAEAARFFPDLVLRRLQSGNAFDEPPGPVIWLASYTQLRRHRDRLGEREFLYAVLDEAQVIKNPDAKVSQACWAIRARHRLALTGTPIENRHLDVWTIFRYLMPGLLGSRRLFEEALQGDELKATLHLRRQLAPFVLRRTKSEVGKELPEKIEMMLPCPMTDVQVSEYKRLVESAKEFGDNTGEALKKRPMPFLSLLTRLRQTCCDPDLLPWRHDDVSQSGKLMALGERLETVIQSGRKAVVFSQFVRLLDRAEALLEERFPDVARYRLDGSTTNRSRPVAEFQASPGAAVIFVSLKAGGTGITLHAADYVFLLDPWWNPAVEAQAIDRVHRIGQTRRVMVYRLVTRGTVEERIEALKERKREQFDAVVGGMDGAVDWATQFSRLTDLIAFRDSA